MHAVLLCLVSAAVGIDVGWQKRPEGGMEYIIQLDPATLESLRDGQVIQSDVPARAGDVRAYRIMVGKETLPKETPPEPKEPAAPGLLPERHVAYEQPDKTLFSNSPPPQAEEKPGMKADDSVAATKPAEALKDQQPSENVEPEKPWLPLTLSLLGLFASVGLNLFLGWVAWDSRRQIHLSAAT